jgi:hypothetical protein
MGARRPLCLLRLALLVLAAAAVLVPPVHAASSACAFGDPECTLYIADLDRSDFLKAFLMFGIPCVRLHRRCKLQTRLSACQSREAHSWLQLLIVYVAPHVAWLYLLFRLSAPFWAVGRSTALSSKHASFLPLSRRGAHSTCARMTSDWRKRWHG